MNDELTIKVDYDVKESCDSDSVGLVRQLFGVSVEDQKFSLESPINVSVSGISLILGRSGSGKSSVLRRIEEALGGNTITVTESLVSDSKLPLIDLIPKGTKESIRILGKMGLAEARILVTPYRYLSNGQQARAQLAIAIASDSRVLIVDEFLTTLDRKTARFVAFNFQRLCRKSDKVAFLATSHDDLCDAIAADFVYRIKLDGNVDVLRGKSEPLLTELSAVTVHDGTRAEYDYLERFHYIQNLAAESPLTENDWENLVTHIRVAKIENETIGVLICTRPFSKLLDAIPLFRDLNNSILVFYRTIVHPGYRGVGIATRFLLPSSQPQNGVWLSCSAMGKYVPFRIAMGFEQIEHPRNVRFCEHDELESIIRRDLEIDPESLHNYATANNAFCSTNTKVRSRLRALSTTIMSRYNLSYCKFLACLSGLTVTESTWNSLEDFFDQALNNVDDENYGTVVSESLHIPVQGFIRKFS